MFPEHSKALAKPNGLLAVGGELSVERLVYAYRNGIFPWFDEDSDEPVCWWTPDPRAVLPPDRFHASKSLLRQAREPGLRYSVDEAIEEVLDACATLRGRAGDTWLGKRMRRAYLQLHDKGLLHTFELRRNKRLIGGVVYVQIGAYLSGETMFSAASNASKLCLLAMCRQLARTPGSLLDCQVSSPHLRSLGSVELPRDVFLQALAAAQRLPAPELAGPDGADYYNSQVAR